MDRVIQGAGFAKSLSTKSELLDAVVRQLPDAAW